MGHGAGVVLFVVRCSMLLLFVVRCCYQEGRGSLMRVNPRQSTVFSHIAGLSLVSFSADICR
jgi:hypothetical protein